MKTPVLFLIFLGVVFAREDSVQNKADNKNGHQASESNALETASTRNAHMQYQGNRMDNVHNQEQQKFSQHAQQMQNSQSLIQHQNAPFHSGQGNQGSQMHAQEQFHSQNQAQQFHNQAAQVQQFRSQAHLTSTGSPLHSEQEIANLLQSQQRMTPTAIAMIQAQSKEQVRDYSAQQVYSGGVHPEQELYQERRNLMEVQDKLGERRYGESTTEQNQLHRGVQSTEIRASGFPAGFAPVYLQRSAFDNREQPLVLPGVSQTHSTSVVVSGLKNLPTLPGLVYSAGPVPTAHAVAYSRPWFQGGAYVKQHWQTPYARYVYSHIL